MRYQTKDRGQVVNADSIAMNGSLEHSRRTSKLEDVDNHESQFFSLSIDHESAFLNVHWLSTNAEDGQSIFHVEGLFCKALDTYRRGSCNEYYYYIYDSLLSTLELLKPSSCKLNALGLD